MRVLVTGGAGYIGSVVVQELLRRGHEVCVVDDLSTGHRAAVDRDAHFTLGDIGDRAGMRRLLEERRIEIVVHMAAAALVEQSMREPRRYFDLNVVRSHALLEAMLDCGVGRLVMSSSCSVYGHPRSTPIDESHPEQPINNYGLSKLMLERMLSAYHAAYGLRYVALRYFNAAGASGDLGEDHDPETHVIPLLLRSAAGRAGAFRVFGTDYESDDGTCVRDYVHVSDLAVAHALALDHIDRIGGASLNLGTGSGTSVQQLVDTARRVTGCPITVEHHSRRPGDPSVLVAAADAAHSQLGWRAKRSDPETLISTAWEWHRRHPGGYGGA